MVKLFNLDLHISVISDFINICNKIYPNEIQIDNYSLSGHSHLVNKERNNSFVINSQSWKYIDNGLINLFYEKHKDLLSTYDGFVVTHSPIFCLLYEKFNKPIILINSCRYEQPASHTGNLDLWNFINTGLRRLYDNKLLFSVSNNLFDKEYLKLGTCIDSICLSSLCLYPNVTYELIDYNLKNKFLLYSSLQDTNKYIKNSNIININNIKPYTYNQLIQFKAIIHIPYEISTMSLFEHYSMNMPLIIPTKRFLLELYDNKLINFYGNYPVLFNTNKYPKKMDKFLNSNWFNNIVNYADYYNDDIFKYIIYFDSFEELNNILINTNFDDISNKISEYNKLRRFKIFNTWSDILNKAFNINKLKISDINLIDNINNIITTDRYMNFINKLNKNIIQYLNFESILNSDLWKNSKTLVFGPSNHTFINKLYYYLKSQSKNLNYIFSINCDTTNSFCYSIPLGLTNDNNEIIINITQETINKDKLVYLNINPTINADIKIVLDKFKDKSYVTYDVESKVNYLRKIKQHQFVLCPSDNGIDTHKIWETLYMGSIPIVIYNDIYASMLDLPILFINDWDEISEEFLNNKLKDMLNKTYNIDKMFIKYWFKLFMNKCQ